MSNPKDDGGGNFSTSGVGKQLLVVNGKKSAKKGIVKPKTVGVVKAAQKGKGKKLSKNARDLKNGKKFINKYMSKK